MVQTELKWHGASDLRSCCATSVWIRRLCGRSSVAGRTRTDRRIYNRGKRLWSNTDQRRASEEGFNAYLTKPIDFKELDRLLTETATYERPRQLA